MKLHDKRLQWIYDHTDMLQRAVAVVMFADSDKLLTYRQYGEKVRKL